MPKLKCNNKECKQFNIEIHLNKIRYVFNEKEGKLHSEEIKCPDCGQDREDVTEFEGYPINYIGSTVKRWQTSTKGTHY
jgi:Zn finger protein HypA/HybF involved in hydrogenase expression